MPMNWRSAGARCRRGRRQPKLVTGRGARSPADRRDPPQPRSTRRRRRRRAVAAPRHAVHAAAVGAALPPGPGHTCTVVDMRRHVVRRSRRRRRRAPASVIASSAGPSSRRPRCRARNVPPSVAERAELRPRQIQPDESRCRVVQRRFDRLSADADVVLQGRLQCEQSCLEVGSAPADHRGHALDDRVDGRLECEERRRLLPFWPSLVGVPLLQGLDPRCEPLRPCAWPF